MNLKNKGFIIPIILAFAVYILLVLIIPGLFFARGKSLYDQKEYKTAASYLKKALIIKPNNLDYRYYYVSTLSNLKPVYSIQKEMYAFAEEDKDDGASILAREKINEWKININQNIGNNYIEQAPSDSKIIRWSKSSFPLKVYIDDSNQNNLPDYYKSSVLRALNQWEKSVDFISFVNANKKSDAQIIISFEKMPDNICSDSVCKYVVGYTNPKISGSRLKNMNIILYDKNPKDEYFSDKEIYNTILHELGHALGIMGHSYSTDDLMYQQAQEYSKVFSKYRSDFHYLSGNDVNTIQLLYMLEPTITDKHLTSKEKLIYTPIILGSTEEIARKKVKEALSYIKSSPELSVGYINLAGAYADLKEYQKAIDALQNALDLANTNNEKFVIYFNFAYVYMNMEKYETALQYALFAEKIQSSQDILELISIIKHNKSVNNY